MIYAGIGSRETPQDVLEKFVAWGRYLAQQGIMLRSGRAKGADTAFENGCILGHGPRELYTANDARGRQDWYLFAASNGPIVLGADLRLPADFVICWTKDGKASGGTGQALRIAEYCGIEIFNFFYSDDEQQLREWLMQRGYK